MTLQKSYDERRVRREQSMLVVKMVLESHRAEVVLAPGVWKVGKVLFLVWLIAAIEEGE